MKNAGRGFAPDTPDDDIVDEVTESAYLIFDVFIWVLFKYLFVAFFSDHQTLQAEHSVQKLRDEGFCRPGARLHNPLHCG